MNPDEDLATGVRKRRQFGLRALFAAITTMAVGSAVVSYVGLMNIYVLVLLLGPIFLVIVGVVLSVPGLVAKLVAESYSEEAAGGFLLAVPGILAIGISLFTLSGVLSLGMVKAAFVNCYVQPWLPLPMLALVCFPILIFGDDLQFLFRYTYRHRFSYNLVLTWSIFCAVAFFCRCPAIYHSWYRLSHSARVECASLNLLLYLVGAIPISMVYCPLRLTQHPGILVQILSGVGAIAWGNLVACFIYAVILSLIGGVE